MAERRTDHTPATERAHQRAERQQQRLLVALTVLWAAVGALSVLLAIVSAHLYP